MTQDRVTDVELADDPANQTSDTMYARHAEIAMTVADLSWLSR